MTVKIKFAALMSHSKEMGFNIVVCMPLSVSTNFFIYFFIFFCSWHEEGHKIGSRSIGFGQSPLDPQSTHKSFIFHQSHSVQVSEIELEKQKKPHR